MKSTLSPADRRSNRVDAFLDRVYRGIFTLNKILLILMVLVISYTVFGRFVLNSTPSWGEEIGTFCMVWIALLSSSLAVRNGRHIRMTLIEYVLPKRAARRLHQILHLFILLTAGVFIFNGVELTKLVSPSILPATRISSGWLTLAIPFSGILILLMLIARFRRKSW